MQGKKRRGQGGQARVHGEIEGRPGNIRDRVIELVCRIPRGKVMTYGQISAELESRISPLAVGWMLHRCPEEVPWHRVVNASGACSTERLPDLPPGIQRALLEAEGVEFDLNSRLDLDRYRWVPAVPKGAE